jgi:peptide/nickel transport system substrate-binding protein
MRLLFALLLLLGATVPAAARGLLPPDTLRVAIPSDLRGTDPGVSRDGTTDTVLHHVVESLVAYRDDLTVAPLLAQRIEHDESYQRFTFVLREGVLFHNGAPLTSHEVKWSWDRLLDPRTRFRCRSWYDGSAAQNGIGARITAIETPDPRTVVFRFDRPNPLFLDQMASVQCITAILHPESVNADGSWRMPVGTGPYRLGTWKRGEYVELDRFDRYRPRSEPANGYAGGRVAKMEHVRFLIIPDASVVVAALRAGDLDVAPRVPRNLTLALGHDDALVARSDEELYWNALLIQTQDPFLANPAVRRALAQAIDPAQVAAITTFDQSKPNPAIVPRISPFHSATQDAWWRYDPAAAREALREAGYDGRTIWIQTNRKFPAMFENAVAIQAMLVAVGLDARLEVLDWTTQLANYFAGKFQLQSFGYSGRAHPVLFYAALIGSKKANPAVQWDDPRAVALLREAGQTADVAAQQALYDRLHELMREDVPVIGLYNETATVLLRPEVQGYAPWPIGHPRLWGVDRRAGS